MPIYEYKCQCGKTFDEIVKVNDRNLPVKCECGKEAKRNLTAVNLIGFDKYGRSTIK